ncbi:hypothetical protein R1sor_002690 [Riccia sorocarpa]|uniref:Uncharacterized protein n=1 Tax=Riccia sorocarpa TaxID=122646 RepID=A0ABD3H0B2_9MARC
MQTVGAPILWKPTDNPIKEMKVDLNWPNGKPVLFRNKNRIPVPVQTPADRQIDPEAIPSGSTGPAETDLPHRLFKQPATKDPDFAHWQGKQRVSPAESTTPGSGQGVGLANLDIPGPMLVDSGYQITYPSSIKRLTQFARERKRTADLISTWVERGVATAEESIEEQAPAKRTKRLFELKEATSSSPQQADDCDGVG